MYFADLNMKICVIALNCTGNEERSEAEYHVIKHMVLKWRNSHFRNFWF